MARFDLFSGQILQGADLLSIKDNNKIMITLDGRILFKTAVNPVSYNFLLAEDSSNITFENTDKILLEG